MKSPGCPRRLATVAAATCVLVVAQAVVRGRRSPSARVGRRAPRRGRRRPRWWRRSAWRPRPGAHGTRRAAWRRTARCRSRRFPDRVVLGAERRRRLEVAATTPRSFPVPFRAIDSGASAPALTSELDLTGAQRVPAVEVPERRPRPTRPAHPTGATARRRRRRRGRHSPRAGAWAWLRRVLRGRAARDRRGAGRSADSSRGSWRGPRGSGDLEQIAGARQTAGEQRRAPARRGRSHGPASTSSGSSRRAAFKQLEGRLPPGVRERRHPSAQEIDSGARELVHGPASAVASSPSAASNAPAWTLHCAAASIRSDAECRIDRQGRRALQERGGRREPAACLGPARGALELDGDVVVGARGRLRAMPRPAIGVGFGVGGRGRARRARPADRSPTRSGRPRSARADAGTSPARRSPAAARSPRRPRPRARFRASRRLARRGARLRRGRRAASSINRCVSSGNAPMRRR